MTISSILNSSLNSSSNNSNKIPGKNRGKMRAMGVAVFWLLLWHVLSLLVGKAVILPSPFETAKTLFYLLFTLPFWQAVGVTLLRIIGGFLVAVVSGAALAVITHHSRLLRQALAPVLSIIKAAPVASFIILMLIWLPNDSIPACISFLMVLPIVWGNVEKGLANVDAEILEMAGVFKLSFTSKLKRIYIPSIMPFFMAGAITSMGLAWKAGVAAEVLCTPRTAIGSELYTAKIYLETTELFAWTAVIIILSIILEKLFVRLLRLSGKKYNAGGESA